jgi:excisionase family DNA binding protein
MTKTYNITREVAAKMLNISTRTIDRYIKSGKLSYKKVANKVLMAREEISDLQEEFSALRQEVNTEIM